MVERTSKTSIFAASVVISVNLIVMVLTSFLFAFGLWMIASPSTLYATLETVGNSTVKALLPPEVLTLQLGIGVAVIAIFFLFLSIMGFYGAITRSPFLLFMYSTLILLLLLLECAMMYYFSTDLKEKGLQVQDGQWTHALRLAFQCCEHNTSITQTQKPAWSCCGAEAFPDNCTSTNEYTKNCKETIPSWLERYQTAIYATLAATHLVLASFSIVRRRS